MKLIEIYYILIITCSCLTLQRADPLSYLKISILSATNLHCKLNNEFHCNPYATVSFKHSKDTQRSSENQCTKSPQFNSHFEFNLDRCEDLAYVNFYQNLIPADIAFLGSSLPPDDTNFQKGEIFPNLLGRVVLDLSKLPFGTVDDWFMLESPIDNSRIMFPSCIHLRISYTSTMCSESINIYQMDSIESSKDLPWNPNRYIPLCKDDFAAVYKSSLSIIQSQYTARNRPELNSKPCIRDHYRDYGFLHRSNLTGIEEALVYKIVKRTIGEDIVYEEFRHGEKVKRTIDNYKEFFAKDCYQKEKLTIARVNRMLKNEAEKFPIGTLNPYVRPIPDDFIDEYPLKLATERLESVFNDTVKEFFALEDNKNLDTMNKKKSDIVTYENTITEIGKTLKHMKEEHIVDATIFTNRNKVHLGKNGRVIERESHFFTIYSLYKWNAGVFDYDTIKREYLLKKKDFECYERVNKLPTNIIWEFVDVECPLNYVCIDPNGIVYPSKTEDPRLVFADEIANTRIRLGPPRSKQFRFKEGEDNDDELGDNTQKLVKPQTGDDFYKDEYLDEGKINDILNFEKLANSEIQDPVSVNEKNVQQCFKKYNIHFETKSDTVYLNKYDKLFIQRQVRIRKKKEIVINRIFYFVPLLGETLALSNIDLIKNPNSVNEAFLLRERNILKKYMLLWESRYSFVEHSSKVLLDLIMCDTDANHMRYLINEMLEGVCVGDDRSMHIFKEILYTLMIDTLFKTTYFEHNDLQAKYLLITVLNKPFCFKPITKIRFIQKFLMLDDNKDLLIRIIIENATNAKSNNYITINLI